MTVKRIDERLEPEEGIVAFCEDLRAMGDLADPYDGVVFEGEIAVKHCIVT